MARKPKNEETKAVIYPFDKAPKEYRELFSDEAGKYILVSENAKFGNALMNELSDNPDNYGFVAMVRGNTYRYIFNIRSET